MILLVLCAGVALRRSRHVWLALPLVISFVLMFGTHLHVEGTNTGIPLPGVVVPHLPVFSSILPVRLCLYVFLFSGLLVGGWLDERIGTGRRPLRHWAPAAGLAAVALVPLIPSGPLHAKPITIPHFFTSADSLNLVRPGAVVLVTPYPSPASAQAMGWQAAAGMHFRMPGGYFLAPDAFGNAQFGRQGGSISTIITLISRGLAPPTPESDALRQARAELVGHPYDAIVVGPMPHQLRAARFVRDLTGLRAEPVGGVWLFRFPQVG